MKRRLNKRKATTLIELIVVLVMMSLFIMIVFNMFSVTYDGYLFNKKMAAKMYAQTNVDNFFEIFEKELMYAGSMENIIQKIPGLSTPGSNTALEVESAENNATITTRYALAEKIILTKAFIDDYDQLEEDSTGDLLSDTGNASKTYFALFDSDFPPYESSTAIKLWSLGYESMEATPNTTLFKITEYSTKTFTRTSDSKSFKGIQIDEVKTKENTVLVDDDLKIFISPLLYEKTFKTLNNKPVALSTSTEWLGEMIYKTKIYTQPQENNKKTMLLTKTIPTIDASFTIKLIKDVTSFQATKSTTDSYVATVTYSYPIPGTTKEGTISVSRRFLKSQ